MNMYEEISKQFTDSNSIKLQLAEKLTLTQNELEDLKVKYQNLESDFQEEKADLNNKLNNFQGFFYLKNNEFTLG
jgi:hypothetical protein